MSERTSRIYRGEEHLARAFLTKDEMTEPVVVAVGDCKGELLPPYAGEEFGLFALKVLDYLAQLPRLIKLSQTDYEHWQAKAQYPNQRIFEVVGMNAGACVAQAVWEIIEGGDIAYVQSKMISDLNSRTRKNNKPYSEYTNGRIVINEVLSGAPSHHVIIPGREQLVFYKQD